MTYSRAGIKVLKFQLSIFVLIGMLLSSFALAQTREETEAWVIQQSMHNTTGLSYSIEGDIFVRQLQMPVTPISGGLIRNTIPIGKVSRIVVEHTDRYLSYTLSCDSPCVDQVTQGIDDSSVPGQKRPAFLFEIYRHLDGSFPPRMNRALLKLVELHGGKAELISRAPKSEAF